MKPARILSLFAILSTYLAFGTSASAGILRGVVVDALDGESITVKADKGIITVHLCAISVPQKSGAFAELAHSHLGLLAKGKEVSIDYNILARDGSVVGIVTTADGIDVGMQMIRDGAALYNRMYEADVPPQTRGFYEQSEQAARAEGRGLWENRQGSSTESESGNLEARKLSNEARELILQGDTKAAMAKVREAIRLDPKLGEAHKNLALLFSDSGRCEDALPEAREAVRLSPDLDKAHNVLGKVLHCLGNFADATNEYNRAIAINPRYGIAWYNLGVSYDSLKQFEKSLTAYHHAEVLLPDLADTQLNIGWVLYQLGRTAEARQRWRKVLTMGNPVTAAMAEQNLTHTR